MIKVTLKQLNYAVTTNAWDAFLSAKKPIAVKLANRKMPEEVTEALQMFNDEKLRLARELGVENKETQRYERIPENKALYDKIAELEQQTVDLTGNPVDFNDLKAFDQETKQDGPWNPDERVLGALESFIKF